MKSKNFKAYLEKLFQEFPEELNTVNEMSVDKFESNEDFIDKLYCFLNTIDENFFDEAMYKEIKKRIISKKYYDAYILVRFCFFKATFRIKVSLVGQKNVTRTIAIPFKNTIDMLMLIIYSSFSYKECEEFDKSKCHIILDNGCCFYLQGDYKKSVYCKYEANSLLIQTLYQKNKKIYFEYNGVICEIKLLKPKYEDFFDSIFVIEKGMGSLQLSEALNKKKDDGTVDDKVLDYTFVTMIGVACIIGIESGDIEPFFDKDDLIS